ncbi:MAG: hypothetical protein IJ161_13590 [Bacteroidales bacterium]|nr:hypothetical protein [Bacteroidales bacterium]
MTVDNYAGVTFNRFRNDPPFQRGLASGGRILVQGSMVVGRYGRSVSTAPYDSELELELSMEQERVLEEWARSENIWFPDSHKHYREKGYLFYGFGGEAQVYTEGDTYVHKICRISQYDSPQRFFDRLVIENAICPEASLTVEGFSRDMQGDFVVLLKQRFFRQAHLMTENEIALYMKCMGFYKVIEEPYHNVKFYSDKVIVEDLHPGNIWMTENGNVVIVDAAFFFNTPGLGFGGTFHYGDE